MKFISPSILKMVPGRVKLKTIEYQSLELSRACAKQDNKVNGMFTS